MNYQKSKAPLALMEQLIMILVFAVAAAVCMQAFVYSDHVSRESEQRDLALTMAQEVIENCKAENGDLDAVCQNIRANRTENGLLYPHAKEDIQVELQITESTDYLESATVIAKNDAGEELCLIRTAWQKGEPTHE